MHQASIKQWKSTTKVHAGKIENEILCYFESFLVGAESGELVGMEGTARTVVIW